MKRLVFFIFVYTQYLFSAGGIPMITNGTGTPGSNGYEVNIVSTGSIKSSSKTYEAPLIDFNYGLGDTIQLKAESAYVYNHNTEGYGLGDAKVGVKWRFYENQNILISIYPQYKFSPIYKNIKRGFSEAKSEIELPIELEREFGNFSFVAEVGYISIKDAKNEWEAGALCSYKFDSQIEAMVELFGIGAIDKDEHSTILNVGFTYPLNKNINTLASLGREIDTTDKEKETIFLVGLQFLF